MRNGHDHNLLIVDDKKDFADGLARYFSRRDWNVDTAYNGKSALAKISQNKYQGVILDVVMPDLSGFEVLQKLQDIPHDLCIIMLTALATKIDDVIKSIKMGAFHFFTKPDFDPEQVELTMINGIDHVKLKVENSNLRKKVKILSAEKSASINKIIGSSNAIVDLKQSITKISSNRSNIIISGQTGTGKTLVAKTIHYSSDLAGEPFVALNCAAIPENLIESELFGYEKGAFTSAEKLKIGKFELAGKGTLFLDEIGEMSTSLQAKVLSAIGGEGYQRLGGNETFYPEARIIVATNKNLAEEVSNGNFRNDLYFRLRVIDIVIPALRERRGDIPLLVDYYLRQFAEEFNQVVKSISNEAMDLLINYDFPGNVRELRNIIERALVWCTDKSILPNHLPEEVKFGSNLDTYDACFQQNFREAKAHFEKNYIINLLKSTSGNISRAAEFANMDRSNLKDKMDKYSLDRSLFK